MYQDEIFENALRESKEESFKELQAEVKGVERIIERMLSQFLECTSAINERDYNLCGV